MSQEHLMMLICTNIILSCRRDYILLFWVDLENPEELPDDIDIHIDWEDEQAK